MAVQLDTGAAALIQQQRDAVNAANLLYQWGQKNNPDVARIKAGQKSVDDRFAQLYGALSPMALGQDSPFSPTVIASLQADASDAAAGEEESNRQRIAQAFGAAMAGGPSGGQLAAELDARRMAQQGLARNRRAIDAQSILENYGARERGLQSMAGLLAQQVPWQLSQVADVPDPLAGAFASQIGQIYGGVEPRQPAWGGGGAGGFMGYSGAPTATNPGLPEQPPAQPQQGLGGLLGYAAGSTPAVGAGAGYAGTGARPAAPQGGFGSAAFGAAAPFGSLGSVGAPSGSGSVSVTYGGTPKVDPVQAALKAQQARAVVGGGTGLNIGLVSPITKASSAAPAQQTPTQRMNTYTKKLYAR